MIATLLGSTKFRGPEQMVGSDEKLTFKGVYFNILAYVQYTGMDPSSADQQYSC